MLPRVCRDQREDRSVKLGHLLPTLGILLALSAGCSGPEAKFVLDKGTQGLVTPARKGVEKALTENFGTPHKLVAWQKLPVDYGEPDANHKEAGWKLLEGRNLYMRHCLHCHGVSGDGEGPTAPYLNPRPRDYRQGKFKFTSTGGGIKACRDDLKLIINNGIPGTSMPSFIVLLKPQEQDLVVEYVRWLAMRGEFERKLVTELTADYSRASVAKRVKDGESQAEIDAALKEYLEGAAGQPPEFQTTVADVSDALANDWTAAEDEASVIVPKYKRQLPSEDPQSVARGRALYMSAKLKCYGCHGMAGKGDGNLTVDYWAIPGSSPEQKYTERGLHDDWGNVVKPRNLTTGQFRGGRRPVDLYRRIYVGIKGTQMAGFATALRDDKDEQGNALTPEQIDERLDRHIWDIVNYILDVPQQKQTLEPLLPPNVVATTPAAN